MKSSILILALSFGLLSGCDETPNIPAGSNGTILQYLQSMDSVRVSLTVFSRHSKLEKPGELIVIEGARNYWFTNFDTTSTLQWGDSGFSAKAQFGFRQFSPFPQEYYFPNASSSVIAGFYDEAARTVRDMRCVLKFYEQMGAPDYRTASASLAINEMRRGALNDDSVEFFATGRELKDVVTLGFNMEENFLSQHYLKQVKLDSIMWEDPFTEPELRIVFFRKENKQP